LLNVDQIYRNGYVTSNIKNYFSGFTNTEAHALVKLADSVILNQEREESKSEKDNSCQCKEYYEESEEEGEKGEYTIPSLEERLKAYSEKVINRANKILDRGRALKFTTKTFNKLHVGDTNLGELLICSVACTQVLNARMGNHQKPAGDPEAGKTHALRSAGKLLPAWKYRETTFSPKVLYYMEDLLPGTIIFTDDIDLEDPGVVSTVKKRTADFSEPVYLDTIIDGKPAKLIIPERINFWFSSVESMDDVQFASRFYVTNTENGKDHNHKVNHLQKSRCLGSWNEAMNEDVLVCMCMFEYICSELYTVFSAYGFVSNWSDESKKRNFDKFMDLLFSVTVLNYRQREKNENGELISNLEDWKAAVRIYAPVASNTSLMLTDEEITILYAIHQLNTVLGDDDGVPLRRIFAYLKEEKKFSKSIDTMRKIIIGNGKDSKGFKEKVPGFSSEKADKCKLDEQGFERKGEGKTHTWCYKYEGDIFDDIPKDVDIITYIKNTTFVTCDCTLADALTLICAKEPNFVYKMSQNVKTYENWKKKILDNSVFSESSEFLGFSQIENSLQSETLSQPITNNNNNNNNNLSDCKKKENTLYPENCVHNPNSKDICMQKQKLSPGFFAQSEQSEQSEAPVIGTFLQSENLTLQSENLTLQSEKSDLQCIPEKIQEYIRTECNGSTITKPVDIHITDFKKLNPELSKVSRQILEFAFTKILKSTLPLDKTQNKTAHEETVHKSKGISILEKALQAGKKEVSV